MLAAFDPATVRGRPIGSGGVDWAWTLPAPNTTSAIRTESEGVFITTILGGKDFAVREGLFEIRALCAGLSTHFLFPGIGRGLRRFRYWYYLNESTREQPFRGGLLPANLLTRSAGSSPSLNRVGERFTPSSPLRASRDGLRAASIPRASGGAGRYEHSVA